MTQEIALEAILCMLEHSVLRHHIDSSFRAKVEKHLENNRRRSALGLQKRDLSPDINAFYHGHVIYLRA